MNKNRKKKIKLACDLETNNDGRKEQNETFAFIAGGIELDAEDLEENVKIVGSLDAFFNDYIYEYKCNVLGFFHNLKFDGSFLTSWLLRNNYRHSVKTINEDEYANAQKDMKNNEFITLISAKCGIWYSLKIKHNSHIYEFRDSYKLLPYSLDKISKDFDLKHKKKSDFNYISTDRYENCPISDTEKRYFQNDCLALKEALNILEDAGFTKMTAPSCAFDEFKKGYHPVEFAKKFPNLYGDNFVLNEEVFGYKSAGEYIRASYHGGWCVVNPKIKNKVIEPTIPYKGKMIAGFTADVNSLYASVQISEDFPVGYPHFFKGDVPKDVLDNKDLYYFVRVKTRFYLKPSHLPTIQIKGSMFYPPREWLTTSDYIDKNGNAWKRVVDSVNGGFREMIPTMVLTCVDWKLMQEHYDLESTEVLDGCWFYKEKGIFDNFINKYAQIKKTSKGSKRSLAKLMLCSLYGKTATSIEAGKKIPFLSEDGVVHFVETDEECIRKGGYIPIGSAITSAARNFTIRAAQMNFSSFLYSDTDSLHLNCSPDDAIGLPQDNVEFSHWKFETCWERALFVRPKTYVERVNFENLEPVDEMWNVKCAGMPERARNNFANKLDGIKIEDGETIEEFEERISTRELTEEEIEFYKKDKMSIEDFKVGLLVPGSIKPKRVKGGIILMNGLYKMRPQMFRKNIIENS